MFKRSRVICNLFGGEFTVRELLVGIAIFSIYIILGFYIHSKIRTAIDNANMKYANAYFIQDDATFVQAYETEQNSDVFAYGVLKAENPITINDWIQKYNKHDKGLLKAAESVLSEKYSYIYIQKEHYTLHTRIVIHRDANGNSYTTLETYYTWDTVWEHTLKVDYINFCGITFDYNTIKFYGRKQVGYEKIYDDRWFIYADPIECSGIAFLHIDDKDIGKYNMLYKYQNTVEACEELRETFYTSNWPLIGFWIAFILIGIILIVGWAVFDNDWLNRL